MVSVGIGGYDLLRLDPQNDVPVLSGLAKGGSAVVDLVTGADDGVAADLQEIAGDITDLGGNVLQAMADPVGWLINTGLTFLVDVIQPLDDLLGLVTGNPERMDADIQILGQVADQLRQLATAVDEAAAQHLVGWQGLAGDAAKERLALYCAGTGMTAQKVDQFAATMGLVKAVMEIAQSLILSIISTFVEWLFVTWAAAMAAAAPTCGASTAVAAAATEVEAGVAVSRGVQVVDRVVSILQKLGRVAEKLGGPSLEKCAEGFRAVKAQPTTGIPSFRDLAGLGGRAGVADPRIYGPLAGKAGIGTAGAAAQGGLGGGPSDTDITRALTGD